MFSVGEKLTEKQKAGYVSAVNDFLSGVNGTPRSPRANPRSLAVRDFPPVDDDVFFRFVTPHAAEHIHRGSFRLGTAAYYRQLEDGRSDRLEGHAALFLEGARKTFACRAVGGASATTLSGVGKLPRDQRTLREMREKFGSQIIRVQSTHDFASILAQQAGATSYRLADVKYCDGKFMTIETPEFDSFIERFGAGNLTEESLHAVNVAYWDSINEHLLLPSIFSKPVRYSFERERRLAFFFSGDVRSAYIDVFAPGATALVEFL